MSPELARRAFEPFFTTKGVGKGTGLGLSQVYAMAQLSGGTIRFNSEPGRGTTVRILLPRADASEIDDSPSRAVVANGNGQPGATILLVDDDVRRWLTSALALLGYRVIEAADGPGGLRELEQGPDLLLVDFAMPGMNDAEVVQVARTLRPDLPVVLVTGFADTESVEAIADRGLTVLRKPFKLEDLEAVLNESSPARGAEAPL